MSVIFSQIYRLVVILTVDNFWVYPFLRVMPPPVISVFFAASFFVAVGLYFFGKILGNWRWRGGCGLILINAHRLFNRLPI